MKKLLLLTLLVLISCSPESNIKPTIDRTNQDIMVRVIFHENNSSLEEAYRIANNLDSRTPIPEQWGFAQWNEFRDRDGNTVNIPGEQYQCTIHTFQPKRQDDQLVRTMGHELLHCIYGSYHN
jgi:hypothetical protein